MSETELVIHAGVGKSACKSCRKPIVWAFTTAGKKAPFEEHERGEYILENGTARHVGPPAPQLELLAPRSPAPAPTRYVNHFSTCPHASKWRGEK